MRANYLLRQKNKFPSIETIEMIISKSDTYFNAWLTNPRGSGENLYLKWISIPFEEWTDRDKRKAFSLFISDLKHYSCEYVRGLRERL